ncbi:alpha/beta hydrolase [Amycolatopsis sp. DG1A-15b]|uniref:alpha/beta fold hydrolase n=1 Tax=Amycolatopsis sp. DG1A-15b TaxID=3052846 RepID=UPI00255BEF48|nr:alpha/beta hydrolase [Amycolatopsis sp. DG1A-15b]WIX91803.1 alpha/beta hydrolase [Amycolatopsis sp. DG1A-15b]
MFEGFTLDRVDVGAVTLRVRHGGSGPPVLLLHGHPRTHTTWHRVAPRLAERFTVVCPDTRGYGESTKPPTDAEHTPYSKRVMAADCVALMRHLGHDEFFVAGHDRGAYVATRLALDHPDVVRGAAILDAVPIGEALARCDARFARDWYHWFFFAQPEIPERVITADPDAWYDVRTRNTPERLGEENFADFHRAIHDPATVTAMLEDYRAGLGVDRAHDDADRAAGRRITCPTLVLWSRDDDMEDLYGDVLAVWRPWTADLRGHAIESGHHVAEENPEALATALSGFFGGIQR